MSGELALALAAALILAAVAAAVIVVRTRRVVATPTGEGATSADGGAGRMPESGGPHGAGPATGTVSEATR